MAWEEILKLQQNARQSNAAGRPGPKSGGAEPPREEVKTAWHLSKSVNLDIVPIKICTPCGVPAS